MTKCIRNVGDVLIPSSYQRNNRNGKNLISGIIIETKDDLFGMTYYVLLSNGLTKWIDEYAIKELFDVL